MTKPTFTDFYSKYPRKKARGDAEKAWQQVLKKGADPQEIMAGLERNLASMLSQDPQFVKYPASWLRAQCWYDEPDAPKIATMKPFRRTVFDAARDLEQYSLDAHRIEATTEH